MFLIATYTICQKYWGKKLASSAACAPGSLSPDLYRKDGNAHRQRARITAISDRPAGFYLPRGGPHADHCAAICTWLLCAKLIERVRVTGPADSPVGTWTLT